MTLNGTEYIDVFITGVPDGVSPLANETLIPPNSIYRLYIFADQKLDEEFLNTLDNVYGKIPYPIIQADVANGSVATYPKCNFNMCLGTPSNLSEFVEYRYLQQRHTISNITFDSANSLVYRMVMPEQPLLVLIMPENFVRTGLKCGYFRFENNLIVRIYSKYFLSSRFTDDEDNGDITVYTSANTTLNSLVLKFFGRLDLHKISSNHSDHIYAYDRYLTAIVGSISNVVVP